MKTPQLPLDFSLNVKAEGVTNLNIQVKAAENGTSMLISPDKNSHSAFKVVTPKHADGKFNEHIYDFCQLQLDAKNSSLWARIQKSLKILFPVIFFLS